LLQHLGGVLADPPGQEQVIEDDQVRRDPVLEQLGAFVDADRRAMGNWVSMKVDIASEWVAACA